MNELWRKSAHKLARIIATYVYVSNAEDGDIGVYTMDGDGTLKPGGRVEAGKLVIPNPIGSRPPGP